MARARLYRIAIMVFIALGAIAGLLGFLARRDPVPVLVGSCLLYTSDAADDSVYV